MLSYCSRNVACGLAIGSTRPQLHVISRGLLHSNIRDGLQPQFRIWYPRSRLRLNRN
jgi:hypothetical protein